MVPPSRLHQRADHLCDGLDCFRMAQNDCVGAAGQNGSRGRDLHLDAALFLAAPFGHVFFGHDSFLDAPGIRGDRGHDGHLEHGVRLLERRVLHAVERGGDVFIAIAGIIYLFIFSSKLLPSDRPDIASHDDDENNKALHPVEAVIGPRFPGIEKKVADFDFTRHYGATIKEIRRKGYTYTNFKSLRFREGDTLVVLADDSFIKTWGESSVFLILTNGKDNEPAGKKKRWFALVLLVLMIAGSTIGELPAVKSMLPEGLHLDMFFFVSITTVIMAWTKLFPPQKYTKYISWDILVTIACAFAISKAMVNSGVADFMAKHIIALGHDHGPYVMLAALFIITNIFTELITNNAAAALSFPLALSLSQQLGVSPMPFFVVICMAASASFSTPISYQTNLIVQGIGNYKFTDFVRIGLPLNIITFFISIFVIPQIWPF